MSRTRHAGRLALLIAAACLSTLASATAQRAFVASHGADNPNCSLTSPCRTLAAAIAATAAGGEVIVLDSAGYGPVTIGKSVSIVAPPGVYAGVSVLSGDGVTINGAGIIVVLRGLTINGVGGLNGVTITDAATVRIEGCVIANLNGVGIYQTAGALHVEDTTVRNNASIGIWSVGSVRANLDRVRMEENLDGVRAQDGAQVAVNDSVMTRNAHVGAFAFVGSNFSAVMTVSRSVLSFNQQGGQSRSLVNGEVAQLTITDSTVTHNNPDGLLATQDDGGHGWLIVTRTTSRDNAVRDLDLTANTAAWLDANNMAEVLVAAGAVVISSDNNAISFPTVLGTVGHQAPF